MPSVTPDLLPPTRPLDPVFPLGGARKPLTLYPGATGEIRVRWHLRANDVVAYSADFPRADGVPSPVLRLGRVRVEGGSEPIGERRLRLSGLGGSGEAAFQVDDDVALFEAELGLMNPEGGWLLLARSNRLQQARGLGLESLRQSAPSARPEFGCDRDVRSHPAEPVPTSTKVQTGSVNASFIETRQGAARPEAVPVDAEHRGAVNVATAIPVLTYADPAPSMAGVVIEAELRIHGWSAPNAEIDLFGHRYRVGPGGRFQLSLKVDDPELIRRALERHPPPELGDPR
ncbi:hypothetical protein [Allochromatium palmeri]|uniref:Uncharacterized protein n=1 Tax=Allochromatium palmeri TaxID=231048 RepID=A0A6N8EE08_9GAMM|nr:hypothetical protein [Allochromatium palmeri]MTW20737.1 hypothetical protein [Allochromatium palmeri]